MKKIFHIDGGMSVVKTYSDDGSVVSNATVPTASIEATDAEVIDATTPEVVEEVKEETAELEVDITGGDEMPARVVGVIKTKKATK